MSCKLAVCHKKSSALWRALNTTMNTSCCVIGLEVNSRKKGKMLFFSRSGSKSLISRKVETRGFMFRQPGQGRSVSGFPYCCQHLITKVRFDAKVKAHWCFVFRQHRPNRPTTLCLADISRCSPVIKKHWQEATLIKYSTTWSSSFMHLSFLALEL